jgi:hypothetical protein
LLAFGTYGDDFTSLSSDEQRARMKLGPNLVVVEDETTIVLLLELDDYELRQSLERIERWRKELSDIRDGMTELMRLHFDTPYDQTRNQIRDMMMTYFDGKRVRR